MRFGDFSFGAVQIDGVTYRRDVVIDRGKVRERNKRPSKEFRDDYGHTPLSALEKIPWDCHRLVVGTGANGSLPVMADVEVEAKRRGVELVALPTPAAIARLKKDAADTNAILHVTC